MAAKKAPAKKAPAKKASVKKAPAKKAPAKTDGEALTRLVLAMLGITEDAANETPPGVPMAKFLLEGEQTAKAYGKAASQFAKVPSFDVELASAAPGLVLHAKARETEWSNARFAKQKGEGRLATRKDAESYRSEVIRNARFLFRKDKSTLNEVDRIAEGEGLPDLIRDHEELAKLAGEKSEDFAKAPKLGDVVARCTAFAEALKSKRDDTDAQALHQARNRAVVALNASLEEIRAAAKFLYEGDTAAMAPYLATRKRRNQS